MDTLHSLFSRHGVPAVVRSDNGPQFASEEFRTFSRQLNFQHVTSSPHHPQSNGEAERMVRTVKDMLKKNATTRQLYDALLAYRATALPHCRYSPAELLMGRKVKTPLPQLPSQLLPDAVNHDAFQAADAQQKAKSTRQYDLRHRTRDLPPLVPGDTVTSAAGPSKEKATVIAVAPEPRSLVIRTQSGAVVRRNRCHLRKHPNA